ncbi:MAG: polymer-forming cytoskeletal protein [Candidatus Margulisbacteria bacterium]|nr:polymer-forming cytoskeletal protein [Candidatus Margulisiibacteriota bacterium]
MKVLKADYKIDETIQTIVGVESYLTGTINTESSIRIEGGFTGEINSQGVVFVGLQSKIKAQVHALRLIVAGELEGNVEVVESIDILSTGKLIGNITGKRLVVDEGALFQGKVNMDIIAPGKIEEE